MVRYSLAVGCLISGLVIAIATSSLVRAQSQVPGNGGGVVMKQPWDTMPAPLPGFAQPGVPNNLPAFTQPPMSGQVNAVANAPLFPQPETYDPNADIAVQDAHGPWMVLVHWYTGQDAPKMAREFVLELRNAYKLPAYVFNRGADERKKEYERLKGILEQQQTFRNAHPDMVHVPGRVKTMKIEDQCAVLVGGYKDDVAARKALDRIRELKPPNPERVKLATKFYQQSDPKTGQQRKAELVYINPFSKAMVVRNPAAKHDQRPADWDKIDINVLKKLNRDEPFSLLECKKSFTLAIKQFHTPTTVQPASATGKFLETLGLGKASQRVDTAALNAHNMAEYMRTTKKLDAYVLHTKFASIVTVGAYDSPDDPNLRAMQRQLVESLKLPATPMPMQVPR